MLLLRPMYRIRKYFLVGLLLLVGVGCQDWLREEGLDAYRKGDMVKAKNNFSKVVKRDPTDWKGHYYLGLIAMDEGAPHVAQSQLEIAYTLRGNGPPRHPETPMIADALAESIYRQENYVRLVGFCDDVIKRFGTTYDYMRKARYLVKVGDYDSAETAYLTAIRIDPRDRDLYLEMADFYETLGKHEGALIQLRKAYGLANSDALRRKILERINGYGVDLGENIALPPDDSSR